MSEQVVAYVRNAEATSPLRKPILRAFLNCLSDDEVLGLFDFTFTDSGERRQVLLQRIVISGDERCLQKFLDALLVALPNVKRSKIQSWGSCVYQSAINGTDADRLRAGAVLESTKSVWNSIRAEKLIKRTEDPGDISIAMWLSSESVSMMRLALRTASSANLVKHADKLYEETVGYDKAKLMLRIAVERVDLLDRMFTDFPISWLYVCAKRGLPVRNDVSRKIAYNSRFSRQLDLVVWCLGRMGHWEVIAYICENESAWEEERIKRFTDDPRLILDESRSEW